MKPNIFQLATKELSQDAFFTWFLQWADKTNKQFDKLLNSTAVNFIQLLIGESNGFIINTVKAERQWNNIDISVEVNDDIFIAIEDKTNTGEHSEQLERYKQISIEHYENKRSRLYFIYLKTGNESASSLKKVEEKGYRIIDRKSILSILNNCQSNNHILIEYRENLNHIDDQSNSYNKFENIISDWKAAEGFFIKLQELLEPQWTDWRYVANQTGGFLGFWYHWIRTEHYNLYIQIENAFDYGIKLVIKIGDWEHDINTLYKILSELKSIANENDLKIIKPDKYRTGETSTLAVIENAFYTKDDETFNLSNFLRTLKKLENILDTHKKMITFPK